MSARGTVCPGALRAEFLFNPERRVICLPATAYTKSYSLTIVLVPLPFDRPIDVMLPARAAEEPAASTT